MTATTQDSDFEVSSADESDGEAVCRPIRNRSIESGRARRQGAQRQKLFSHNNSSGAARNSLSEPRANHAAADFREDGRRYRRGSAGKGCNYAEKLPNLDDKLRGVERNAKERSTLASVNSFGVSSRYNHYRQTAYCA